MATYLTPGVYTEEIPTIPGSVAPVSTAVPAFVGYTEKGFPAGWPPTTGVLPPVVKRITSMMEYVDLFGGAYSEYFAITYTSTTGKIEVGLPTYTPSSGPAVEIPLAPYLLYHSVKLYFQNGGGPCYIVSVGGYSEPSTGLPNPAVRTPKQTEVSAGIAALEGYDEPTLLCIPDSIRVGGPGYLIVAKEMLMHCVNMRDRFTIMDPIADSVSLSLLNVFRSAASPTNKDALQYGAAYLPRLKAVGEYLVNLNSPVTTLPANTTAPLSSVLSSNKARFDAMVAAIHSQYPVVVPASGAVAGIYCSVDRDRGVWKAPANVSISGIIDPTILINDQEQEIMNVDANGKAVNAIRNFAGRGTLVWGARTLACNDLEWRYVPVRRFFIFAEESIQKALTPIVFEPNTAATWARVKGLIGGFLTNLWRQGALAGNKPEDAFFVNVGLGTTMSAQDILDGHLIVEVGIAAVRPAEFVIMRFQHKIQEA
jgi:uncharacterized protein